MFTHTSANGRKQNLPHIAPGTYLNSAQCTPRSTLHPMRPFLTLPLPKLACIRNYVNPHPFTKPQEHTQTAHSLSYARISRPKKKPGSIFAQPSIHNFFQHPEKKSLVVVRVYANIASRDSSVSEESNNSQSSLLSNRVAKRWFISHLFLRMRDSQCISRLTLPPLLLPLPLLPPLFPIPTPTPTPLIPTPLLPRLKDIIT